MSGYCPSLLIVTYHYVRDPGEVRYPGIHPVSMQRFRNDLARLGEHGTFVTPSEAEKFLTGGGGHDGPQILITFDDGLQDHWRAAQQALDPLGIKGAFFVSSRPLTEQRALLVNKLQYLRSITPPEAFRSRFLSLVPPEAALLAVQPAFRAKACGVYVHDSEEDACVKYLANFSLGYDDTEMVVDELLAECGVSETVLCDELYMNPDQMRSLHNDGHMIACHGHTHRPLGTLLLEEMDAEVSTNRDALHGILGERPGWISFPYVRGDAIPQDTERLCETFDFRVALTLMSDWNVAGQDPLRVCRVTENQYAGLLKDIPRMADVSSRRVA